MIKIQKPNVQLLPSYLECMEEMRQLGEMVWENHFPLKSETHQQFVERLIRSETEPLPGLVPENHFWGVDSGNQVVGRIAFRHHLNDALKEFGGHIGYEVRPSVRRQGVAKEMLKQILEIPKAKEAKRILLTCAPDNVGSNKTITANGGVLEKTAYVEKWKRDTNYYWIVVCD